jgi:ADP-ribose pyrophosphatase YjhB (NUDIX family)
VGGERRDHGAGDLSVIDRHIGDATRPFALASHNRQSGTVPAGASGVIIGCCNLVERDGSYLLVREGKPSALGRFNLPAGKPEIGETLIEAAVREAKEESGLDVTVDHMIGFYHCPQNDEGFGVLNVVFASSIIGGEIVTSAAHPEVRYFTRAEVADLSARHLLRGSHIELAMDAHALGQRLPLDLVQVTDHEPDLSLRPESR